MSKLHIYIAIVCVALSSCSEKDDLGAFWGDTEIYDDFLFNKYTPTLINKTMELEFNEHAKNANAKVHFGLFKEDGNGGVVKIKTTEALLHIDDKVMNNNEFTINQNQTSVKIGIEVRKDTPNGRNSWLLKTMSFSEIDRIDDIELDTSHSNNYTLKFYIKKAEVMNDLSYGLSIFAITIISILIIWLLILKRMFYPTFKSGMLTFQMDIYKPIKIKGARKVVCTNKPLKQSSLNAFFTGRIIYFNNPFWTKEWLIIPNNKKNIKVIGGNFMLDPYAMSISKGTEYTLQNIETNEKITVTYI